MDDLQGKYLCPTHSCRTGPPTLAASSQLLTSSAPQPTDPTSRCPRLGPLLSPSTAPPSSLPTTTVPTWEACEIDKCNAHVGQGFDYHFHGDPFGPSCLYNASSYGSNTHPPLIGFGLDGPWLFGRYTGSTQPGFSVALDACGGHTHDSLPYHYHSQVLAMTTSGGVLKDVAAGQAYTAYPAGPLGCWRGNISAIPSFWDERGHTAAYGNPRDAPPAISSRSDYALLRPCCGSTSYYLAPGFSLNGAAARVASTYSGAATPAISDPAAASSSSSTTTTTSTMNSSAAGSNRPPPANSSNLATPAAAPAVNGSSPPPAGKNSAGSHVLGRAGGMLMVACGILSLIIFGQC
ncbi:hypothetical protein CHLRE_10g448550v5 [Chlamydomonas reinhardtii]|uniref:YHYH domain-containing protein n=1 Tax=Chlamydomonas reinhardtii TaxID=3055 RepID=A0A2K3DB07_CHLRE|nr:uncharacterized protein CHLRE_10g448550v5 [Chlamydomonas reinhardtii]PNW77714.1 hypothetical protein CHLRE_10g448550v5 [Chlamydomonas reinhardtii]